MKTVWFVTRKSLKLFLVFVFIFFFIIGVDNRVLAGPVNPPGENEEIVSLNVGKVHQNYLGWCWAASIQSVAEYYGISANQTYVYNYIKNFDYSNPDATNSEILDALNHYQMYCSFANTFITTTNLKYYIDDGRPSFAALKYKATGAGGHIIVIRGYDYDYDTGARVVMYMDPNLPISTCYQSIVYADLLDNTDYFWKSSFKGISTPSV